MAKQVEPTFLKSASHRGT